MPDVVSPILIGRDREVSRLRGAVARTIAGEPCVVLVGGEAGVGKSRLLHAALGTPSDVRVLIGRCIQLGGEGLPFVPLVEALRTLVRTTSPDDLDRLLGPARAELGRLLPELTADRAASSGGGTTAQLFELVLGVLGRIGQERPLVLVFEDLHWADRSTLDLVAFLVRALQGARVLLVLTYRSDEVERHSPLRPLLTGWERMREVERVHLEPFDRAEVTAQVTAILGATPDDAMLEPIVERAEGNAFFVEELVRTLREGASEQELPPSLRDVLLSRAERLSGPAQQLLRTAAVAGRWVPERLLAGVTDVPAAELFSALREAVDASLLVVDESGRGYAFRHALTRDAVYQDLLPGERAGLHTAIAQALDRDPGLAGDDASVAATLAVHWYAAHDLPRALAASVRAGREGLTGYAPAEARRHLERALEVWHSVPDPETWAGTDEVEVLQLAAQATFRAGDPDRALPLLRRAQELVGAEAHPERAAFIVDQRAFMLRALGRDSLGTELLEEALARLPENPPTLARATVLASLANSLMRLGEQNSAALGRTALETARAIGARSQEASALITIGLAIAYLEDPAGGEDALREGLRLAVNIPDHEMALRGYVNLSDVLESRGQHREAVEAAREGLALAARVGLSRSLGSYLSGNLAESLVRLGEWTEARRLAAESTRFGLTGIFSATWHELVGYMAVMSGQHEEALAHVRAAVRELGTNQEPQFLQSLAYLESEAARARGDDEQAAAVVRRALEGNTPGWSARYAWPLVWQAERIAADRAWRARDRNEPPPAGDVDADPGMTPDLGTVAPSTIAYRALAAAEGARRALADPVPAWREAVEAWQRAGDAWPLAYARYRLAEALLARGDRDEAAGLLPMTVAVAEQLGAHPLHDDALALARRARVPLGEITPADEPATADTAPFRLTEREREVLALVAAGRSNGQIATELFISPKTASVHVSNILAKLGVGGRVEAAGVAHRLGLIPPA